MTTLTIKFEYTKKQNKGLFPLIKNYLERLNQEGFVSVRNGKINISSKEINHFIILKSLNEISLN